MHLLQAARDEGLDQYSPGSRGRTDQVVFVQEPYQLLFDARIRVRILDLDVVVRVTPIALEDLFERRDLEALVLGPRFIGVLLVEPGTGVAGLDLLERLVGNGAGAVLGRPSRSPVEG